MTEGMTGRSPNKPMRRDAVIREKGLAERMIRFVVSPEGQVMPDLGHKLPGRGIWLKPLPGRIEQATKRGVFARAARRPVKVDPELGERVRTLLVDRLLETVSLANRAGQIVTGFDKVQDELKSARNGVLLIAQDAGVEAKRLIALLRERRYIAAFDRNELGRRLGRDQSVYAFISQGALADRLITDANRLAGFQDVEMAPAPRDLDGAAVNGRVSLTQ